MPRRLPSGRWQGSVRVGQRRVSPGHSFALRREALAWEEDQRSRIRAGSWVDPAAGAVLFESWVAEWQAARTVEPETAAHDARTIARTVLPRWRGLPLGEVARSRIAVQAWVSKMSRDGAGAATVRKAYGLFTSIMGAAVDEELVARTPCRKIRLPEPAARRLAWWEPAQVEAIVAVLPAPHASIAAAMAWCGLRWEEAAALPVGAVNWLRREVTVTQVVTSARRIKKYPKSAAGRRTVRMAGPVADLLEPAWRAALEHPHADGLIWVASDGRPLLNRTWGAVWRNRVRDGSRRQPRPDVLYHSPHVLRHSGASWLAQAGVPMADIQAWLGHGDPDSTRIYAHLAPERSAATIGEALASLPGKTVSVDTTRGTSIR